MSEITTNKTLRVAIMCNGFHWQHWQECVFKELQQVKGVEVVLLIQPADGQSSGRSFGKRLVKARWSTLLYRKYRQQGFGSAAMKVVHMKSSLGKIPVLNCAVKTKKYVEYFHSEDISKIKQYDVDVIIRLGFNILKGEILHCAKHGIWSFHHGDEEKYRGGPPALWEIVNDEKTMGVVLQRLTEKLDGGFILKKGCYKLWKHSLADSIDGALIDSAIWPAQLCRKLIRGQLDVAQGYQSKTTAKVYKYPNNWQYLRFRLKLWRNKMRFHQEELNKHEEWNIGVLNYPISEFLKERPNQNVRWLPNPAKGSFRADPFGFLHNNELVVLYEKYDGKKGRGVIARLRPKPNNILKRSKTILDNEQHLSYPFIVQKDGKTYVIPESFMSKQVMLYELSSDLDSLEPKCVLLDQPLLDPTLVYYNDLWWMMGTLPPNTNVGLYLFYSENLEGPYQPHQMNPVKSDIGNARPGGTPFVHEGQLYRPAQDSSETYGGRIIINRVLQLDKHDYQEEFVKYIDPLPGGPHNLGVHTISAVGDLTLVDGKRFIINQDKQRANLRRKVQKLLGRKW